MGQYVGRTVLCLTEGVWSVEVIESYDLMNEKIFPAFLLKNLGNQEPDIRVVSRQ